MGNFACKWKRKIQRCRFAMIQADRTTTLEVMGVWVVKKPCFLTMSCHHQNFWNNGQILYCFGCKWKRKMKGRNFDLWSGQSVHNFRSCGQCCGCWSRVKYQIFGFLSCGWILGILDANDSYWCKTTTALGLSQIGPQLWKLWGF